MTKSTILCILGLILLIDGACQSQQAVFVPFTNKKIRYEGRIGKDGASAILFWSGTQIEVIFNGTGIDAIFFDDKGNNYYNIIIDDDSSYIFRPSAQKKTYSLASGLEDKDHKLKIYKRTEWNRGTTYFYGFVLENGTILLDPPPEKNRKMEFYGNSITAGFGVEDNTRADRSDSIFTNNYLSYAALTARHFNAQSHYIVRSGIGVMVSWFPLIMPEMYARLNPNDAESKWNFNSYLPGLVIINLLQNDAYLLASPKSKEYLYRFENKPKPDEHYIVSAYTSFVKLIREKYPHAEIICMLGNLGITKNGSPWPGYVTRAVQLLDDQKVHTFFMPYKNSLGHPKTHEQKVMADSLIKFIEMNISW